MVTLIADDEAFPVIRDSNNTHHINSSSVTDSVVHPPSSVRFLSSHLTSPCIVKCSYPPLIILSLSQFESWTVFHKYHRNARLPLTKQTKHREACASLSRLRFPTLPLSQLRYLAHRPQKKATLPSAHSLPHEVWYLSLFATLLILFHHPPYRSQQRSSPGLDAWTSTRIAASKLPSIIASGGKELSVGII